MMKKSIDVLVVGGGPAGLGAAIEAKKNGASVLIVERNKKLGGILNQCIHPGFGLLWLKEDLTGPEYADRFVKEVERLKIPVLLNSMVLDIKNQDVMVSGKQGLKKIRAKAIVLAMGCRERTRGALMIPGTRPSGIFTAGTAQNFMNLKNLMVGKRIVILGSGDVGMIMARRLTLEGAKVVAVLEVLPHCSGLSRNLVQCLRDFDIPLLLSHTVTEIRGKDRLTGVTISKVDDKLRPLEGNKRRINCDTLLLSVGLIPENELSKKAGAVMDNATGGPVVNELMETSVSGIFACGNVLHVHDVVDFATAEATFAGKNAALLAKNKLKKSKRVPTIAGDGIGYVLPHRINPAKETKLYLRVKKPAKNKYLTIKDSKVIHRVFIKHLNPAEMISVDLAAKVIKNAKKLELAIE